MIMNDIKNDLNEFFVDCFYTILRNEEQSLENISNGKLSLKEIHVIEAITKTKKRNENTHAGVARMLQITPGSLTVAVNVLERKGYVIKRRNEKDKRITYLELSELGEFINQHHEKYHDNMIEAVVRLTDENEQKVLTSALKKIAQYFKGEK